MALYFASLLTFSLMFVWAAAHFIVWQVPSRLYHWVSGQPWGRDPWVERVIQWFTVPLIWLGVLFVIWAALVILLGRPAAVLRRCGFGAPEPNPSGRGRRRKGLLRPFWQTGFQWTCCRYGVRTPRPYEAILVFAWFGFFLAGAACALQVLFPGGRFLWASRPSVPLVCFFVVVGMSACYRATARLLVESGELDARSSEAELLLGKKTMRKAKDNVIAAVKEGTAKPMFGMSPEENDDEPTAKN